MNIDEKKRSDFWFQASEMLFESQRDAVDENVALKQENARLIEEVEQLKKELNEMRVKSTFEMLNLMMKNEKQE